ncbi:MAG: hypothetical protein H7X95_03035 [Deltaproteobacteria bacterium]|nr:hypothetical protein [Deltaproteobacteria bacterium]
MRQGPNSIVFAAALIAGLARVAQAAPAAPVAEQRVPTAADFARIESDMARVQQDLREQKQLILQLMQMHDALLKYLHMGGGAGNPATGSLPLPSSPAQPSSSGAAAIAPSAMGADGKLGAGAGASAARAFISGKVRVNTGQLGQAYVYLDGPKSLASRTSSVEVKQVSRQFVPAVSVVQVGTRVLFPNEDRVFHNVFSRTPGDAFDLGTLKSGDRPNPVVLLKPGHIEIFCNIHSKMRADILVVPNSIWTRVRPDGSFQLSGVPVGVHRVVLWGPDIKAVTQRVEVTAAGGTTAFSADGAARRRHLNKQGGAYESYEE